MASPSHRLEAISKRYRPAMGRGYAVIDLETTGVAAAAGDRVIEMAIVTVDASGAVEDNWATLLNPRRAIGATEIHGIRAEDVIAAPTFAEVAPAVIDRLAGRVMVAHNARFETGFLSAEFAHAGIAVALPTAVCTMESSRRFLPGTSRKLADCCAAVGVPYTRQHAALADATAAAGLLRHYLTLAADVWRELMDAATTHAWPLPAPGWASPPLLARNIHEQIAPAAGAEWLGQLTSVLPRLEPALDAYADVLDAVLIDGHLAQREVQHLTVLARSLDIPQPQIDQLHRGYFAALATAAWADGTVTVDEQMQLTMIAVGLGISMSDAGRLLAEAESSPTSLSIGVLHLSPRDRVALIHPIDDRGHLVDRATAAGLVVVDDQKSARYVVTSDPDEAGVTAAHEAGVPVVTDWAFLDALERLEEQRRRRGSLIG